MPCTVPAAIQPAGASRVIRCVKSDARRSTISGQRPPVRSHSEPRLTPHAESAQHQDERVPHRLAVENVRQVQPAEHVAESKTAHAALRRWCSAASVRHAWAPHHSMSG